jgi:hypothetical protein
MEDLAVFPDGILSSRGELPDEERSLVIPLGENSRTLSVVSTTVNGTK